MNRPPVQLEGIDAGAGLRNVGGDHAFYVKLLERFLRAQQAAHGAFDAEAGAGNWTAVGERAHALRGSAAGIGAHDVHQAAETLELAVAQQRLPAADEVQALCRALGVVVGALETYFSTQLDSRQELVSDMARALAAKAQLDVMLSEFSGESLDYFDECRADFAAALPLDAMLQLEGHLERYEFDAARALLELHLHTKD
jgi:HPt (histidine-containing phosphotransfer) domain-containing protein